jgi:hypothetical protein
MDGRGISVDFNGHQIVVLAKHAQAAASFGGDRLVVDTSAVAAVSLHPAGFLNDGRLEVTTVDGRRYYLHFPRKQQAAFAQLHQSLLAGKPSPRPGTTPEANERPSAVAAPTVRGSGYYNQQTVGESHYFGELRKIVGQARSSGEREIIAALRREPSNKFDRNAIQVTVEGRVVGYLPREDASSYQIPLQLLERQGCSAVCKARLWWSRDQDTFIASVSLDLADPATLVPINAPEPSTRYMVIPSGRTYQVAKENEHMDVLIPLIEQAYLPGRAAAFGTLHSAERRGPRSTSQVVTVRVGGKEIGELSKQSSAKFLPLVLPMEQAGLTCYIDLVLAGNSIAVEAKLHLTAPEELPADFMARFRQAMHG